MNTKAPQALKGQGKNNHKCSTGSSLLGTLKRKINEKFLSPFQFITQVA